MNLLLRRFLAPNSIFKRTLLVSRQLEYDGFGDPTKVIQLRDTKVPDNDLRSNEIRLNFLAAPINPADINMIQGVYGIKPTTFPAVGGNEGVARVQECGEDVRNVQVGDWIQPKLANFGTWRSTAVCEAKSVQKIDNSLSLVDAATLNINPPTAYRMLQDFVELSPGDTVIQNGSNSAVGRALIQIAKSRGLRTVNLVRSRPDLEDLRDELKQLGADHVLTDEELRSDVGKRMWSSGDANIKPPRLAINCVSGRSTLYLAAALADGGVVVTYGAMAMQPAQFPAGAFIFKDITARGFWFSNWKDDPKNDEECGRMYADLTRMIKDGRLKVATSAELVDYKEYKTAIEKSMLKGFSKKQVLVFDWTT